MPDFLHIYAADGRCITSMPLGTSTLVPEIAPTDPTCTAHQLFPLGYRLHEWHEGERAGCIHFNDGSSGMVRIKPLGLVRDMRPAGVAQLKDALRRDGVTIEPITGIAATSYAEAVGTLGAA